MIITAKMKILILLIRFAKVVRVAKRPVAHGSIMMGPGGLHVDRPDRAPPSVCGQIENLQ